MKEDWIKKVKKELNDSFRRNDYYGYTRILNRNVFCLDANDLMIAKRYQKMLEKNKSEVMEYAFEVLG